MKYSWSVLFLLYFSLNVTAFCVAVNKRDITHAITSSIVNCQFDRAIFLSDSMIRFDPTDPLGPVLKLATLGMRDVDLEITVDSSLFLSTFALAEKTVLSYEVKNGVTSFSLTMSGFTKAIHSSYFLKRKLYVAALQNGLDALKMLKQAKELDPQNTDVDFFLGLYDYAKSELKSKLWWVLFWYPGGKKEGINKLINCSNSACITNEAARLSLSDIYITEKDPDKSNLVLVELEKKYPLSRFVLWTRTKYFESKKMYADAARCFELLSLSYGAQLHGGYNSNVTKYRAAQMYFEASQNEKAAVFCREILSSSYKNKKELIKDTKKLLERIHETGH